MAGADLELLGRQGPSRYGSVLHGYIDQPAHTEIDTAEVKAVVLHDFGPVTLGGAVYYSGDYCGSHRDDVYGEGRIPYRITPKPHVVTAKPGPLLLKML